MFSTLSNRLEDKTFLIKCLTTTMTSISCNTARSSLQESILNDLQSRLLGLLQEKLAEISFMQEGQKMMGTQQGIEYPKAHPLSWLYKIVSGDGLAEKMVEILDATSKYQQVEVISAALPEIIPDQITPPLPSTFRRWYSPPTRSTLLLSSSTLLLSWPWPRPCLSPERILWSSLPSRCIAQTSAS